MGQDIFWEAMHHVNVGQGARHEPLMKRGRIVQPLLGITPHPRTCTHAYVVHSEGKGRRYGSLQGILRCCNLGMPCNLPNPLMADAHLAHQQMATHGSMLQQSMRARDAMEQAWGT